MPTNISLKQSKSSLKDEYAILGLLMPYLMMGLGMLLALLVALLIKSSIQISEKIFSGSVNENQWSCTFFIVLSTGILGFLAWKFYGQRKALYIKEHATITTVVGHIWVLFALWSNPGDILWSPWVTTFWFFGCIIIGLSWSMRRWAHFHAGEHVAPDRGSSLGSLEEIGLGKSFFDGKGTDEGPYKRVKLKLAVGKTVEDAKKARARLAGLLKMSQNRVQILETDDMREDEVDVLILKEEPFKTWVDWAGPQYVGECITMPITYATWENGQRPQIYLAGREGESSQHWLTVGMSDTGKSKTWQAIYGTALSRVQVSLVFIDPVKGLQTAGPLLPGITLFADSLHKGTAVLNGIERAVEARNDHLASQGLSHWVPGCGLNFLIVHVEEASRFNKVNKLIELTEAARSAGIALVLSLQRATADRMKTSVRYNLGGVICHGVRGKRDSEWALSEYTREAGAAPHKWQSRFPGRHYIEADNLDVRNFAMAAQTDRLDMELLRQAVLDGAEIRTPLDDITANALGDVYFKYRREVDTGTTKWQRTLYPNLSQSELPESDTEEIPVVVEITEKKLTNAEKTEQRLEHEAMVWDLLMDMGQNNKTEYQLPELTSQVHFRSATWVSNLLRSWYASGRLPKHPKHGWHYAPNR